MLVNKRWEKKLHFLKKNGSYIAVVPMDWVKENFDPEQEKKVQMIYERGGKLWIQAQE